MRKIAVWLLALVVVAGIARFFFLSNTAAPTAPPVSEQPSDMQSAAESAEVIAENGAFGPQTVTVRKGGSVAWINKGTAPIWPASAMHPTHTVYPGSDIGKCGTAEKDTIFDACRGIPAGQSYTFTFSNAGTWRYHNHLNPSMTGSVIVKE